MYEPITELVPITATISDLSLEYKTPITTVLDIGEIRGRMPIRKPRKIKAPPPKVPIFVRFPSKKKKLAVSSQTPTPKEYQKQITHPIGELKIVDKEQIRQMRSTPHELHSMIYGNKQQKGLNLI
jgi:hypothetical protein